MPHLLILAADLVSIAVLTFGVYYRRHRGRDMLLPLIGMNIGVLAVSAVLTGVAVGVGVGLGLFGVLAIIRLRSSEISHQEVAYYFAALALGLICGLQPTPLWLAPVLCAMIVAVFAAVDHPRLHANHRSQEITVDAVYPTETALQERLEDLLDARVDQMTVLRTDLVRDMTVVNVRYRVLVGRRPRPTARVEIPADDSPAFSRSFAR